MLISGHGFGLTGLFDVTEMISCVKDLCGDLFGIDGDVSIYT